MQQTRRELLATLVAGGTLVAGCVDDGSETNPANGDTGETDDEPDSDDADPLETSYPGDCPDYETDRVICYEAVKDAETSAENVPAILEPSTRSLAPGDTVEFTLSNQHDAALSANFYNWRLDKQVDGEWYHVAPLVVNEPMMSIPPGESHTWSVQIDNSGIEPGELVPRASGTEDLTLAGLGGGRYAFRARGWFEGGDHEDDIAFAATFEYEGEVDLTPTAKVENTEFDGETLVAEAGDADQTYILERVESGDERLITEQLLRRPLWRDAVALARQHDADRVRLDGYTADRYLMDPLGRFQYDGQHYELTKHGEDCSCRP